MGDYRLPWEPKPTYSHSPAKPGGPKPGDANFIGPISVKQKAMSPDERSRYAREHHLFQNIDGTWNKKDTLPCTPELPNGFVLKRYKDNRGGGGGDDDNGTTKVVNPSNYIENIALTDPDYAAESKIEFNNLTTVEILEISRSGNMSVDSRNLNPNILDIVNVVNTFSPTEIVKLQKTSEDYFGPFEENLETNLLEITTIPGIAQVTIPQQNDTNILKAQIEILVPRIIHRDTIYI